MAAVSSVTRHDKAENLATGENQRASKAEKQICEGELAKLVQARNNDVRMRITRSLLHRLPGYPT